MLEDLMARLKALSNDYKEITKTTTANAAPAAKSISAAVGEGGKNVPADVTLVQQLLNKNHGTSLATDGACGAKTIAAIKDFQLKKLGFPVPDGRIDPNGKTWTALNGGGGNNTAPVDNNTTKPTEEAPASSYYSHPRANEVKLGKYASAVPLNAQAEMLLKSLLAGSGNMSATYTSTLRTYVDQARAMMGNEQSSIDRWYKSTEVSEAFRAFKAKGDIKGFAQWLEARDKKRGKLISNHLPGIAIDVINCNLAAFEKFAVGKAGVKKVFPEPEIKCTHIEFTFKVTGGSASAGGGNVKIPANPTQGGAVTPSAGAISAPVGEGGKNYTCRCGIGAAAFQ